MKLRKVLTLLVVFIFLLGTFYGCGKNDSKAQKDTNTKSSNTTLDKKDDSKDKFDIIQGEWNGSVSLDNSDTNFSLCIDNVEAMESGKWAITDCLFVRSGIADAKPSVTIENGSRLYGYFTPEDNYLELITTYDEGYENLVFSGYLNPDTKEITGKVIGSNGYKNGVFALAEADSKSKSSITEKTGFSDLLGEWAGTYDAGKGKTDVSVKIDAAETSIGDTWSISSAFNFLSFSPYSDPNEPYHTVHGNYDPKTKELSLIYLDWIEQTSEDEKTALIGKVDTKTKQYIGKVMVGDKEIGTVTLSKKEGMPEYVGDYFDANDSTSSANDIMNTSTEDPNILNGEWSGIYTFGLVKLNATITINMKEDIGEPNWKIAECTFVWEGYNGYIPAGSVLMEGQYYPEDDSIWLNGVNPTGENNIFEIHGSFTANGKALFAYCTTDEGESLEGLINFKKGESSIDVSSIIANTPKNISSSNASNYDFLLGTWIGPNDCAQSTMTSTLIVNEIDDSDDQEIDFYCTFQMSEYTKPFDMEGYYYPDTNEVTLSGYDSTQSLADDMLVKLSFILNDESNMLSGDISLDGYTGSPIELTKN